ncbi:hypothetical protein HanRHA438_Chr17g0821301 [Helianthus annuus]|nr:hypothetical protein HanIR_Chr17g0880311 [Helianthus annuus]KAJ0827053.1 hypothetical protein HanRHA438_Chr17g0821301 [Helianthus annuus]
MVEFHSCMFLMAHSTPNPCAIHKPKINHPYKFMFVKRIEKRAYSKWTGEMP